MPGPKNSKRGKPRTVRQSGRGGAAQLQPAAMGSRMARPTGFVPETPMRPSFARTMLFNLRELEAAFPATMGSVTPRALGVLDARQASGAVISQAVPRFTQLRVLAIEAWGGDGALGTVSPATSVSITVTQAVDGVTGGDGAIFRDFGTQGAKRANVRVQPNFAQRQQWLSTLDDKEGGAYLFEVRTAELATFSEDVALEVLVRVTMEMR